MASDREEIINIYDTLPARYNIGLSEIVLEAKPIASSIFASLHKGRWGGRAVAVKKFDLDNTDDSFNLAAKEMSRMIRLRHQNVLKVYGFYFVAEPSRVLKCSMVMELMDFDLDKYIKEEQGGRLPLTDDEVVYIMAEIARGMKHVHKNGYSHRDLKPKNVLMRRSAVLTSSHLEVKVADFGSSELMRAGQCDRTAGTPCYKAPEQFNRDASLRPDKMDVYSFGCTCFKLWTGEDPPFKNHAGLLERWKQRRARNLPGDVERIITECLDIDPDARPGFSKISDVLDAHVLKEKQVEQLPHREEVTDEEALELVVRRREIVRALRLDPGVNGLDYADHVILPEELVLLRKVGGGSEAKVYEVGWKGTRCALKVYNHDHDTKTFYYSILDSDYPWFKMLPTVIHENIVRFLGYSFTFAGAGEWGEREGMRPSILMEFLASDLSNYVEELSRCHPSANLFLKHRRWKIMKGIAEGMKFLHAKDWVHGDLKPTNILVNVSDEDVDADDIIVKLIDFCLGGTGALRVPLRYAAPEILQARQALEHTGNQDLVKTIEDYKKSDVYSFAIVCSDILRIDEDFNGSNLSNMVIGGMRPALPRETSQDLLDLITKCWSHDPAERPSAGDICNFFSHHMPMQAHCKFPMSMLGCKWFQNPCTLM